MRPKLRSGEMVKIDCRKQLAQYIVCWPFNSTDETPPVYIKSGTVCLYIQHVRHSKSQKWAGSIFAEILIDGKVMHVEPVYLKRVRVYE